VGRVWCAGEVWRWGGRGFFGGGVGLKGWGVFGVRGVSLILLGS